MIVQHNLISSYASKEYKKTTKRLEDTNKKLSSGYRINQAKDDAAGLAISEKMRKMIRGLEQGSKNTQDAISMLQVADGAFGEVDDILKRFKELTVKATTDTNTHEDRTYIQKEIDELNELITQIGKHTEFNKLPLFDVKRNGSTPPSTIISFSDINLVEKPFDENTDGSKLGFAATVNKNGIDETWDLIFGGSDSYSNTSSIFLKVIYDTTINGTTTSVTEYRDLSTIIPTNYNYNETTKTGYRDYELDYGNGVKFTITETMTVGSKSDTSQYYNVSYTIKNTGNVNAKTEFFVSADTAYNSDDSAEGYFVDGQRVENFILYTDNNTYKQMAPNNTSDISNFDTSKGFSIINTEVALPFTENIKFTGTQPNTFGFMEWNGGDSGDFGIYDNTTGIGDNLADLFAEPSTKEADLTFTAIWNSTLNVGQSTTYGYDYGILSVESDMNVAGVDITYDSILTGDGKNEFWIQSGDDTNEGIYIYVDRINATILGTNSIDVTSSSNASHGIGKVDKAQTKLAKMRSNIGAYQNRLEHIYEVNTIATENITAAESIIRDTNMAELMLEYSTNQIIQQAQNSIMAQSNKNHEAVLMLLNQ